MAAERSGAGLTATERRVADLIAGGATNRDAAAALFVSVRTVETHVASIYLEAGRPHPGPSWSGGGQAHWPLAGSRLGSSTDTPPGRARQRGPDIRARSGFAPRSASVASGTSPIH